MVTLITRAQWGALPPTRPLTRVPWSEREGVAIHYSQGDKDDWPLDLQRYAQNSLGYADCHYNTFVRWDGKAYEGRGWGFSSAHSEGENRTWVSICFIGTDRDVTLAAEATIAALVADAHRLAGRKLKVAGHQELPGAQTSCPGPRLMALVRRLRAGGGDDDMTPEQASQLADLHNAFIMGTRGAGRAWTHTIGGKSQPINPLFNAIWQLGQGVQQLGADMPDVIPVDVDEEAIAEAVVAALPAEKIADALDDATAAKVVELLAAKLGTTPGGSTS